MNTLQSGPLNILIFLPSFMTNIEPIESLSTQAHLLPTCSIMQQGCGKRSRTDSISSNASTLPPDEFIESHESTPTSILPCSQSRYVTKLERGSSVNGTASRQLEKQLKILQNIIKNQSREISALHWAIFQLGNGTDDECGRNTRKEHEPVAKKIHLEQVAQLCDDVKMWSTIPTNLTMSFELASLPTSMIESESRLCALLDFIFESASKGNNIPDNLSLSSVFDVITRVVHREPSPFVCSSCEEFFEKFLKLGFESSIESVWLVIIVEDIFDSLFLYAKQKGWTKMYESLRKVCAGGVSVAASRLASAKSSTKEKIMALEISSILSGVFNSSVLESIPEDDLRIIGRRNILFTVAVQTARSNSSESG